MSGYMGTAYRGPAPNGWSNSGPAVFTNFKIAVTTQSYTIYPAINDNVIYPPGVTPPSGSPYTRQFQLACGSDMNCTVNPAWCCDDVATMVENGCPHQPWLANNPVNGYNSTFPFIPRYPTASVTYSSSICNKPYGFKNVQAKKQWHGCSPLTDVDANNCPNTSLVCDDGSSITYRQYAATPAQVKYLNANWDLNLNMAQDISILTGSDYDPCVQYPNVYSIRQNIPLTSTSNTTTRTVIINRYSGEATTNSSSVTQVSQNYFNNPIIDMYGVPQYITMSINDQCGNVWEEITMAQWWPLEKIKGCGATIEVQDFPGGYYDYWTNPNRGHKATEDDLSPGNPLAADMISPPNCSDDLPMVDWLVKFWNSIAPYATNSPTSSIITKPAVSVNGWTAHADFFAGYPDNNLYVDCGTGDPFIISDVSPYHSTCICSITRTVDTYTFNVAIDAYVGNGCGGAFNHYVYSYAGNVTLSNPYSASMVQADLDTLSSNFLMDNDLVYPWRTDGNANMAPLLTYNETLVASPFNISPACLIDDLRSPITDANGNAPYSSGSDAGQHGAPTYDLNGYPPFASCWTPTYTAPVDWIETYTQMAAFDGRAKAFYWNSTASQDNTPAAGIATLYGGEILGKPSLQVTGSNYKIFTANWDWRHEIWGYDNCEGYGPVWYPAGYGELNYGQFGIPLTATQWTNYYDAQYFPPYASRFNLGNVAYQQKWAEKCLPFPSWDFNRPYGTDKFMPDQTACSCYTDYDSTPGAAIIWQFYDGTSNDTPLNPPIPPAIGDIWGGTDIDRFVHIAGVSGDGTIYTPYSLTLGSTFSSLPAGFTESFCRLKYPNAPTFGTVPITVNYSGSHSYITMSVAQPQFITSSVVDFFVGRYNNQNVFVPNDSALYTNVTIGKIDDTHASCSANVSSASFLISHGLMPYWCDNQTKGQVAAFTWTMDNRTNGENYRGTQISDCNGFSGNLTGSFPPTNSGYAGFTKTQVALSGSTVDGLPQSNCGLDCNGYPIVAYTNNNESFGTNAVTCSIPVTTFDLVYNSMWQSETVQCQQSFIWQVPHPTCGYAMVQQVNDLGQCNASHTIDGGYMQYYGYPDQIEPFLTLPTTTLFNGSSVPAPNPTGSGFQWQVYSPIVTGSGVTPPYNGGYSSPGGTPNGNIYPWTIKLNACNSSPCALYDYTYLCPEG